MTDTEGEAVPEMAMLPALTEGMPLLSPLHQKVFDVDAFLCSRVPGQEIQDIVKELRAYKATLQEKVAAVVQEKYHAVVSLTTSIRSEAEPIEALQKEHSLDDVLSTLQSLRATLQQMKSDTAQLAEEANADAEERRRLVSLLEMDRVLQSLEHITHLVSPTTRPESTLPFASWLGDEEEDEKDEATRTTTMPQYTHEQRVLQELHTYTWLRHLLGMSTSERSAAYIAHMQPRIDRVVAQMRQDVATLHRHVDEACPPGTPLGATQLRWLRLVLELSMELGDTSVTAAMTRLLDERVLPTLLPCFDAPTSIPTPHLPLDLYTDEQELAQLTSLTQLPWGKPVDPSYTSDLRTLLDALLEVAYQHSGVCKMAEEVGGARTDVFLDLVWHTMADMLITQYGTHLFFVGKPDEFHRNYTLIRAWMDAMQAMAPSARAHTAFRTHATTLALERRWQLSAFFHLCARDRVTSLEAALASPSSTPLAGFRQAALAHLLYAFVLPWRMTRHIPALRAREWRQSMHVLSRYRTWVDKIVSEMEPEASSDMPSRTSTPTPAEESSGLTDIEVHKLHQAVGLLADVSLFEKRVSDVYTTWLRPKLLAGTDTSLPEADTVQEALDTALASSLGLVSHVEKHVQSFVLHMLRRKCTEPLRQVRAGQTHYRAISRPSSPAPTSQSSTYTKAMVRPLYQLWEPDRPVHSLALAQQQAWVDEVVQAMVARYATAIDTVTRNLESLRRLKRGTPGLAADEASNDEHVYTQFKADADALASELTAFSAATQIPIDMQKDAWTTLRRSLRP
ncbi:intra-Golgi vesicle-mediated transport protein [Malassezia pachydermatis]